MLKKNKNIQIISPFVYTHKSAAAAADAAAPVDSYIITFSLWRPFRNLNHEVFTIILVIFILRK